MNDRNILFLSELRHIDACERFLDTHPDVREEGYLLIPLDAEVDYALTKKGIAFQSGKDYRTPDTAHVILGEEWTSSIFESEQWSFFIYRGVSLGQLYFLQLQGYLSRVLYYVDIVSNVIAKHPRARRLIVFPSPRERPAMERCLTGYMINAVVDVVTTLSEQSGKEILVPQESHSARVQNRHTLFILKRMLFGWGISVLNTVTALVRRPQRIRILASDHWSNLAPALHYLDSAEVIFTDRQEMFRAGIANMWKFRMRFLHLDAFSPRISGEQKPAQELFIREWQSVQARSDWSEFSFRGFSIQPLLVRALDSIVKESFAKTPKDIDDAHALVARLKPHVVMLRATVSSQTHFSILAQVAHTQGIPSVEMQHGIMYLGPGSMDKRHSAEFIGVYGRFVQNEMKLEREEKSTPIIIGSPRFDVYARLKKSTKTGGAKEIQKNTFLCIAPLVFLEASTDSYDVVEYFRVIASALQKIPNAHAILKLRAGPNRDPFLRTTIQTLFEGIPYTIAQFEPLSDLYPQADVVISCYSTAALEALQCGKPLVYLGLCSLDNMMGLHHFLKYVEEGAMRIASSKKELEHILVELANPMARKDLSEKAIAFLTREYAFDGKASERTAQFIETVVKKGSGQPLA